MRPRERTTVAFPRFNTIRRKAPLNEFPRTAKSHPNLRNAYLGNDSDNVLTGDFTGDFRSGFGESQQSKSKGQKEKNKTNTCKKFMGIKVALCMAVKARLRYRRKVYIPGFELFLGLKLQRLFKDIPGRNSNFSSTPSSKKCHENAILDDRVQGIPARFVQVSVFSSSSTK